MTFPRHLMAGALAVSLLALPVTAQAAGREDLEAGTQAAYELNGMGLFRGAAVLPDGSPDFQLERAATRGEALVMLIRLLGGEEEALSSDYAHPFTDAGWADDYCGYAYQYEIANGTSAITFGTAQIISREHFLTLFLRAMGYDQVDYRNPAPLAHEVGLYCPQGEEFLRCDMAQICLSALDCVFSGTEQTLRERLVELGAISVEPPAKPSQPIRQPGPVSEPYAYAKLSSTSDLLPELARVMEGRMPAVMLEVPAGQEEQFSNAMEGCTSSLTDAKQWYSSWYPNSGIMNVEITYHDSSRVMAYLEGKLDSLSELDQELLAEAIRIRDTYTLSGMTDYEIVKAYHDYLVNNTEYRGGADLCYDAAGPLLYGYGVCDGYSKAFDLLCYLSGVDCIRVAGTADGGGHAWNKVKLDGSWYNVDVTWDDPVSSRPILRYDYFLVSDDTLARDHSWEIQAHWPAAPADYKN